MKEKEESSINSTSRNHKYSLPYHPLLMLIKQNKAKPNKEKRSLSCLLRNHKAFHPQEFPLYNFTIQSAGKKRSFLTNYTISIIEGLFSPYILVAAYSVCPLLIFCKSHFHLGHLSSQSHCGLCFDTPDIHEEPFYRNYQTHAFQNIRPALLFPSYLSSY